MAYNSPMEKPAPAPPAGSSRWQNFWKIYGRTLALFLSMAVGALLPQGGALSWIVPYLLMGMLFFAFLDISITRESLHPSILGLLLANLAVPLAVYYLLRGADPDLALVGFITAVAPTATATPVIVSYLRGRIDYVLPAVLVTNIGVALILPFALPAVAGATVHITTAEVLPSVLEVMFVPLLLAFVLRRFLPPVQRFLLPAKRISFPIWLMMLFVVMAKASAFLQSNSGTPAIRLGWIALLSLGTCIVNFVLGAWIGGTAFRREASQSLGQKNNSFTIWIALTYLNPLAALGPTFYVLYHNLYNGYQLYRQGLSVTQPGPAEKT
jgi:BASS family bile acid:Na+ symporter